MAVNCAALPSSLLESELFGYEEGAFTGAARKGKPGMFELAHRGSIFLDEVSELDNSSQLRLLRVLQERCAMRLGGNRLIPIDVRVIARFQQESLGSGGTPGLSRRSFFPPQCAAALSAAPAGPRRRRGRAGPAFSGRNRRRRGVGFRLAQSALKRLNRHPGPVTYGSSATSWNASPWPRARDG